MNSAPHRPLPRAWKAAILATAALALVCKIALALFTYGSNDVYAWERFARWSGLFGSRVYSIDAAFNHPPSMIHVLALLTWMAKATGLAFPFWLRLPAILADTAGLWIVSRIFADRLNEPAVRWGLLLLAGSPVLILVSGFHGNTDPVVMLFVLLSVWLMDAPRSALRDWGSGAAFGAAMCVKILPLIVLPVLFFARPGLRRRAIFLAAAAAVMLLCWSPYIFRDPADILRQVVGYQSIYGHWGLTWIAVRLRFFRDSWHDAFQHYGAFLALATIAGAAWVVNRAPSKPPVYAQTGAALFFFLAVCNGFGVQYLAWLVPWTVGLAVIPLTFFWLASGVFLFLVYNFWSGGLPWYLADSNYVGDFTPHVDYFLALCWLSVIALAWYAWKRRTPIPALRTRLLLAALAIPTLVYPAWCQIRYTDARTYPATRDRAALVTIRAQEDADLSQQYYRLGRYSEAVVAARTGVALDPTVLDAWNNLALACIRMRRWDEALNAANNALRLAPNDETANASLAEAEAESPH